MFQHADELQAVRRDSRFELIEIDFMPIVVRNLHASIYLLGKLQSFTNLN